MSARKAGRVPRAPRIPTTAVPTHATTAEPVSMGITGTAASAPQASLVQTVGSILMSASHLRVPLAPPVWMRSMDIAVGVHQTGLDPTVKK